MNPASLLSQANPSSLGRVLPRHLLPHQEGSVGHTGESNGFAQALSQIAEIEQEANKLGRLAATGKLENVHDYTIAATKAQLAVDLTVVLRNRAIQAFNEIMRMPV